MKYFLLLSLFLCLNAYSGSFASVTGKIVAYDKSSLTLKNEKIKIKVKKNIFKGDLNSDQEITVRIPLSSVLRVQLIRKGNIKR